MQETGPSFYRENRGLREERNTREVYGVDMSFFSGFVGSPRTGK